MSMRSNILALTASAVLFCACGSDKNESTPPPEETIQSMSQLKASTMGTCPTIAGRYKCIENCEVDGEPVQEESGIILLKKIGQGPKYHYSSGEDEQPNSFVDYLLSKYMFDDNGLNVDGQIYDKTAPIKNALEAIERQMNGFTGHALRQTLSLFGIDVDQELMKIDIPNITAGYQAGCSENVFSFHYVIDKSAVKFKIKNISEKILEVKSFGLEDQKLQSHTYKVELLDGTTPTPGAQNPQSAGSSLIASWIEKNPRSIRFQNSGVYSYWNGEFLNMVFSKVGYGGNEKNLYVAEYESYWGEGDNYAYDIKNSASLFVDISKLKVFTKDRYGVEKEVGSIYETTGRAYIQLDLDCSGIIFKSCKAL
jgi:hypothetical protein